MIVELKALKPNPLRDFHVDPIDDTRVAALKDSIKEDGFWGGIVCRQNGTGIQIAAGHHRVKAALAAGIRTADVYVADDMDDAGMIRVYARENATQRGNSGTAQAGTVASAVKFLAKAVLTGVCQEFLTNADMEKMRGNIASDKGLGQRAVVEFLSGVPGINDGTVQQQLANLKASGDYARIIAEVQEEIERENKEALAALARAEREQAAAAERARKAEEERKAAAAKAKAAREAEAQKRAELDRQRAEAEAKLAAKREAEAAAELKKFDALRKTRDTAQAAVTKSAERDVTFDFEGVAKHLENAHQIDVFRQCVTGEGIRPYLKVNQQAQLAKRLVEMAAKQGAELSGAFIRENITGMVLGFRSSVRNLERRDREALLERDMLARHKQYQAEFARHCRGMDATGYKLLNLQKQWPKGTKSAPLSGEFRNAVKMAQKIINALAERL